MQLMETIIEKLTMYFQYSFVWYAIIVGVLIAFCSSLFGATLVLKRFSYIGDGLSHVAFGAIAVASVFNITNEMPFVLILTIISAIFLLKTGENTKLQGDAAIGMVSVSSMGVGYLLLNQFSSSSNLAGDVCSTLFGATAILTLSIQDVYVCVAMAIFVAGFFILHYNKIFAVTFDENFCQASGLNVEKYNVMIAIIIAIIIVLAMNLVGSLLISALVIMPALASMSIFKSFKAVIISSVIFSVTCTIIGMLASLLIASPVGATIVTVDLIGYLSFIVIGKMLNLVKRA